MTKLLEENKTLTQIVKDECWIPRSPEGQVSVSVSWKSMIVNLK